MLDYLDIEILRLLDKDARTPFSDIAKMLGVSSSTIQIRFNRMRNDGLILGTTLVLDPEKFGVKCLISVGVKALEPDIQEVIKYMETLIARSSKILAWPTFGAFNISALIISASLLEARKIRQSIKEHPSVTEVGLSVNISSYRSNFESLNLEKEFRR